LIKHELYIAFDILGNIALHLSFRAYGSNGWN